MLDDYRKCIINKIEEVRFELNSLVEKKIDRIIDCDVVELSQKLDKLLLKYIKINKKAF